MPPKNNFEVSSNTPVNQAEIEKGIKKEGVSEEVMNTLLKVPQSTLNSLLLRVARERTMQKSPTDLVADYINREEIFAVGPFNQHDLIKLEYLQLEAVGKSFETVALSPVIPQGVNAVTTKVSQDISLVTNRHSEVNADPTTALALECAKRRRYEKEGIINIATSQRVIRMQPIAKKGFSHHFLLLGLCSSGKNYEREGDPFAFLTDSFISHIDTHLKVLNSLNRDNYEINSIEVLFSDLSLLEELIQKTSKDRDEITKNSLNEEFDLLHYLEVDLSATVESVDSINEETILKYGLENKMKTLEKIEERILRPLKEKYPDIRFGIDFSRKAGLGYYDKSCFHIFGTNKDGIRVQISDGGKVDWVAKMSSDRKELTVTSGMGTEYLHRFFRAN